MICTTAELGHLDYSVHMDSSGLTEQAGVPVYPGDVTWASEAQVLYEAYMVMVVHRCEVKYHDRYGERPVVVIATYLSQAGRGEGSLRDLWFHGAYQSEHVWDKVKHIWSSEILAEETGRRA